MRWSEVWKETGLHIEPRGIGGVFGDRPFRVIYANGDRVASVMRLFDCTDSTLTDVADRHTSPPFGPPVTVSQTPSGQGCLLCAAGRQA